MTPILIKKKKSEWDHIIPPESEFRSVIENIDLMDLIHYMISAIEGTWAPGCYWTQHNMNDDIKRGELYWIIYSYLVWENLLVVEDRYYGYNPTRVDVHKDRLSYYNTLEQTLYSPIIDRLVNEGYLKSHQNLPYMPRYTWDKTYFRNINLDTLEID